MKYLDLPVLVAAGSGAVVLVELSQRGGLDTDPAPCEEAGHIPTQAVRSPCAEVVVLEGPSLAVVVGERRPEAAVGIRAGFVHA